MSEDEPSGMPFFGMPIFGDLAKVFGSQGPLHWDAARQFAALTATGGTSEANVDPVARSEFEDLARIAEMHVTSISGLTLGSSVRIQPVSPGGWAQRTLDAYRGLFTQLATSLAATPGEDDSGDPTMAMLAGLSRMVAPAMMGMAVGSMVGHLARRAFGQYDVPIPRDGESGELLVVPATVDGFAQDWSIPRDEMRLWVLVQELTGHAVLAVPHIRSTLSDLVKAHVGAFRPDPSALADRMSSIDITDADALASLEKTFADPSMLLGAIETPEQAALRPRLDTMLGVVVGYVDHTVDVVTERLLGQGAQIAEAVRRRRVESAPHDVFVERLLGPHLDRTLVSRGRNFISGVVERAGTNGLNRLFSGESALPTPAEFDAPGLWLARLELEH